METPEEAQRRQRKEAAERLAREEVERALGASFAQRTTAAPQKKNTEDAEDDFASHRKPAVRSVDESMCGALVCLLLPWPIFSRPLKSR